MNKSDLIKILSSENRFFGSEELTNSLNISRQGVWKLINSLKNEGYSIESVKGKGYRLTGLTDEITKAGVLSRLNSDRWNVSVFDSLDSTNLELLRQASNGASEGTIIIADEQTGGLGRRGRSFLSPAGYSIFMSILLKPNIPPSAVSCITLVWALAVYKGLIKNLKNSDKLNTGIKWPNDILIDNKKVCGILTQMSAELDYINYVVTGIGINVNNPSMDDSISDTASSLYLLTKEKYNRDILVADIINEFEGYYESFVESKNFAPFIDEYNSYLLNYQKQVRIFDGLVEDAKPEDIREGLCTGIYEDGSLKVIINGVEEKINAGEVSIRDLN